MADIVSPLPGIFHRKPAPDKPAFVEEGAAVEVGATIGIVEIMKQFSEIHATAAGTLEAFLVDDGGMLSPGDVIARVVES